MCIRMPQCINSPHWLVGIFRRLPPWQPLLSGGDCSWKDIGWTRISSLLPILSASSRASQCLERNNVMISDTNSNANAVLLKVLFALWGNLLGTIAWFSHNPGFAPIWVKYDASTISMNSINHGYYSIFICSISHSQSNFTIDYWWCGLRGTPGEQVSQN